MAEYTTSSGIVVRESRSFHKREDEVIKAQKTLAEVLDVYDIVDIEPTHILATDKRQFREPVDMRELGATGQTSWGAAEREEFNPKLRGHEGIKKYDEMRRTNALVRMSLRVVKVPVIGARWYLQPASSSKQDIKAAEFATNCYLKYRSDSWFQQRLEELLMLDYGWYAFEKCFERRTVDGQRRVVWQKFAPRHPLDFYEWKYDAHGGPKTALFYGPEGDPDAVPIPIKKLLVFTHDKEGGNLEGISALRSAYPHWYIINNLYKIDAIQKERHGIGIPLIKLPPGYNTSDKTTANEIGRNLRTNERAHVVLPPGWEIEFIKIEGQTVNAIESVEHHSKMILNNVLAGYLENLKGEGGDASSGADMFHRANRFIADIIRDVHNKWALPELIRINISADADVPELRVRRLGDTVDWRTLSFAVRNLVGAKLMTPSPKIEEWFRDEIELPPLTEDEMEIAQKVFEAWGVNAVAPQAGLGNADVSGNGGMPRQAPATNQRSAPPKSNAGQDTSGGK